MLGVVLSGLVMLKFANTATNFYAFNCLGAESVVLRNKRCELVSKKSEFAEIGMKAALAAATYPKFDRFCDGTIEAEDIARAFAHVDGIPWETAFMVARNILADADSDPSVDGEPKGLNFVEFMTCLEGDAINFEAFLKDTREMFDKYMLEDEAEDLAAGKKPAAKGGKKELTMKEKLKKEKETALKKAEEKKQKLEAATEALKKQAAAAGKDFDDFMKEKEEAEDDAMRERCKKAFEEQQAEISKNKPAPDPNKAKKAAAPSAEPATEAAAEGAAAEGAAPAAEVGPGSY